MKQIWITRAGPPEVLEPRETSSPPLRSGEVRVSVEASGVNFADVLGRLGEYAGAPVIPYVPGFEISGVITEVGQGVPGLKEGEAVLAITRFGGYSDEVVVPHRQVFPRLDWMSAEDGAALPVSYLSAYQALVVMGSLRAGQTVLIHGAASGVGTAAIDICRIVGAETFGTAAESKHEFLQEYGLDHAIDYYSVDYEEAILDLTDGQGVSLILDPFGGIHWHKNYRLLLPTGRLIHMSGGSMEGTRQRPWLELVKGLLPRPFGRSSMQLLQDNKGIAGVNWGTLWEQIELQRQWMAQIIEWYDEALFRPAVDRTYPLEEASSAHKYLQSRRNKGKLLLLMG